MDKLPFTTHEILFTPYPWKYLISFKYFSEPRYCNTEKALYSTICQSQFRALFLRINSFYSELSSYLWLCEQLMSMLNRCCFSVSNFKCCLYFVRLHKKALACWNIPVLVICIYHNWLKLPICFTFCNNKFKIFGSSLREPLYIVNSIFYERT